MPEVHVALMTPFTSPSGPPDLAAIPPHLRWLEANGVDGIVPCGTTGEGPALSLEERKVVIDTCLANRGNLSVMPGTGCANLPETIAATRYALEQGAEAAMVLPPFFFKNLSDAGLLAYYRAVCDALPAGGKIVLYHIPPVSQIPITTGVIDGLLESHPDAIYGLKDSGGDGQYTALLIKRYPSMKIYTGGAPLFTRALADGAAGGIFAITNLFPRELVAIRNAGEDAAAAQNRAIAITNIFKDYGAVSALKALLPHLADLPASSCRVPLVNLSEAATQELLAKLAEAA
ncbi:MAG: dihydrodipicolinate synthase family protein [Roseiflexaceae bacterium]|nr:dihydrodipicolinate synthase family protein [Roseiflexaceae bacterium]